MDEVISSLDRSMGMLEFKLFFIMFFFKCIKFDQVGRYLDLIEKALNDSSKDSIALINPNPIKVLMMMIHTLYLIKSEFSFN